MSNTIQATSPRPMSRIDEVASSQGSAPSRAASAAPAPEFSGDLATALAQLILKTEHANKESARAERKNAEAGMKAAQEAQLKDLTEEADKKCDAATQRAWGQIGSGVLTAGTAFGAEARDLDRNQTPKPSMGGRILTNAAVGAGAGKALEGSLDLVAAGAEHESGRAGVRAKADENLASSWKNGLDDAKDAKRDAEERIGRVHDWLKSIQDTSAQTTMSALKA
jgi:hypothetical protein